MGVQRVLCNPGIGAVEQLPCAVCAEHRAAALFLEEVILLTARTGGVSQPLFLLAVFLFICRFESWLCFCCLDEVAAKKKKNLYFFGVFGAQGAVIREARKELLRFWSSTQPAACSAPEGCVVMG